MKTAGSPGASLRLREKKGKAEGILSSSVILVAVFSAQMQRHIRSTDLSFLKKGGTAGLIPRPFAFAGTGFFLSIYYCIIVFLSRVVFISPSQLPPIEKNKAKLYNSYLILSLI